MTDRPPQTPAEALRLGWIWMSLACVACNHKGEIRFEDFRISQAARPLGALLRKARCLRCGGHEFNMTIATYTMGTGQPFPHHLPVQVEGETLITARRN